MLNVGNPQLIGPFRSAYFDRVAASVVGAIDQDAVDAGSSHLAECDFLLPGMSGHGGRLKRSVQGPSIQKHSMWPTRTGVPKGGTLSGVFSFKINGAKNRWRSQQDSNLQPTE
jgi:hypothetical protein